jgi:F420 biosynthesis protein FbiB-like protein
MIYNSLMKFIEELYQLVRSRRAIRRYQDRPVSRELVERLIDTAIWAPSAHNRQPWRFAVVKDVEVKARLAEVMGKRLYADRLKDGDAVEAIERDVARSHRRITGAPVVVVVFLSMADMDSYPDARRDQAEYLMAVQSVAMAAQNLWLLAHAEGLGACWLCAPLFVPDLVRDLLGLPDDWVAQGLMTLGWPAETRSKERRPWREVVRFF